MKIETTDQSSQEEIFILIHSILAKIGPKGTVCPSVYLPNIFSGSAVLHSRFTYLNVTDLMWKFLRANQENVWLVFRNVCDYSRKRICCSGKHFMPFVATHVLPGAVCMCAFQSSVCSLHNNVYALSNIARSGQRVPIGPGWRNNGAPNRDVDIYICFPHKCSHIRWLASFLLFFKLAIEDGSARDVFLRDVFLRDVCPGRRQGSIHHSMLSYLADCSGFRV